MSPWMRPSPLVALVLLLAGGAASAVEVNGPVYIKAKNTKLLASPDYGASVKKVLQPGAEVIWLGADPTKKQFHQVSIKGAKGYVLFANLSATRPAPEVLTQTGALGDKQAFASSGAATKALGDGAVEYGAKKNGEQAVKDLLVLEALSASVPLSEAAAHAKAAGLTPVVGDKP